LFKLLYPIDELIVQMVACEVVVNVCQRFCGMKQLPIAGDFLSSYTKVEAGHNP